MPPSSRNTSLVHDRLAHWAATAPTRTAITVDAHTPHPTRFGFAELHEQATEFAATLRARQAANTCLLDTNRGPDAFLCEFLGTISTGRCAAVADPAWPPELHERIRQSLPQAPHDDGGPISADQPFYIGFTSGSTGLPKGFRRSHRSWVESFRVCLDDLGNEAAGPILAPGQLSHSLFLFAAMLALWHGNSIWLQRSFSAPGALHSLRNQSIPVLVCVPNQLMMMLTAAARRQLAPIPSVRLILISGARWPQAQTGALQALFPNARIISFYGASETSFISWTQAGIPAADNAVGRAFSNVSLHIGPHPHQPPLPAGQSGLIWVKSPMLFTDYINAQDGTAARRVDDWITVRDVGHLDEDGMLHLDGRENRMIVTQARNLFPEEIEARLGSHPEIAQASVHGIDDLHRSQQVHAVVLLKDGVPAVETATSFAPETREHIVATASMADPASGPASTHGRASATSHEDSAVPAACSLSALPENLKLRQWCRQTLEPYKAPRHWWRWHGPWPLTTSGKTDHRRIAQVLHQHLERATEPPASSHSTP